MKESTGKRLMRIMSDRNLKQIDILKLCEPYCEKYGIKLAKNDLSQYVSDKVQPKQDKLSILAMALGVSEVWLMGYDMPMHSDNSQIQEAIELYDRIQKLPKDKQIALQNYLQFLQSDS